MTNRHAFAALALVVASALPAFAQQTIEEAQAQMRATLAIVKQERADKKAEKAKAAAAAPKRAAELSCHNKQRTAEGLIGTLDLDTMSLETLRSPAAKAVKETDESKVVDGRCGKLPASLADTLTFEVTPTGYWGQDFLQIPKSAAAASGKAFEAQLHSCQYDGEYHSDSDDTLVCTLTAK